MSFQDYVDELENSKGRPSYRNIAMIGAAVILVIGLIAVCFGYMNSAEASSVNVVSSEDPAEGFGDSGDDDEPIAQICVYITGEVVDPGVVYLDEGSRVSDAIEACGGMTPQASKASLNLARVLQDGEQIDVISVEQATIAQSASASASPSASASSSSSGTNGVVNINTADATELQTLSGIGESKAKKIIDYREKNGAFRSIEDLSNVSGIGEKTVENLREYICV